MKYIFFSKRETENNNIQKSFNELDGNILKNMYNPTCYHERYPSPFSALICFEDALLNTNQDVAIELFKMYLKGIFIGMLRLVDVQIPNSRGKTIFMQYFPFQGFYNPFKSDKIKVLKFGNDVVAVESSKTLFFPSAYFSYWPEDLKDKEKALFDLIKEKFDSLYKSDPRFKNGFDWFIVNNLYKNLIVNNERLAYFLKEVFKSSFSNGKRNKDDSKVKSANSINLTDGIEINFYCFNPILDIQSWEFHVKNNSLYLEDSGDSICVDLGYTIVKGNDGEKYLLVDDGYVENVKNSLLIFSKTIRWVDISIIEQKIGYVNGIEYCPLTIELRDIRGNKKNCNVRIIRRSDIFVKKIVKVGNKYPESALHSIFDGVDGIVAHKPNYNSGNKMITYSVEIFSSNLSKDYSLGQDVETLSDNDLLLGLWPGSWMFKNDKWKPYFIYFQSLTSKDNYNYFMKFLKGSGISIKPKGNSSEIVKFNKNIIESGFAICVNNGGKDEERGIFRFACGNGEVNYVQGATFTLDFGTSSSVVAEKQNNNVKVIHLDFDGEIVLGSSGNFSYPLFPLRQVIGSINENEVPSILVIRNVNTGITSHEKVFEEGNIVFFNKELIQQLNQKSIVDNIKWSNNSNYVKFYLYLLLLMVFSKYFPNSPNVDVDFRFTYPLSFSQSEVNDFQGNVKSIISLISTELGITVSPTFVPEGFFVGSNAPSGYILSLDLGGGSTEISLLYKDGENVSSKILESIKFGGELIIECLSKITKTDKIELNRFLRSDRNNESIVKKLQGALKTGIFYQKYVRIINLFIYFVRVQLSYVFSLNNNQQNINADPLDPKNIENIYNAMKNATKSKDISVYLLGNGWKLIDYLSNLNPKQTFLNSEEIVKKILSPFFGNNACISIEKSRKEALVESVSKAGSTSLSNFICYFINKGGGNRILGFNLSNNLPWWKEIVKNNNKCQVQGGTFGFKKDDIPDSLQETVGDNKDDIARFVNSVLNAKREGFVAKHQGQDVIDRSPLAVIVEEYFSNWIKNC